MENLNINLDLLIDWQKDLPYQVLKFTPNALYFFERPILWNVVLPAQLLFANKKVFGGHGYLSVGSPHSESFHQSVVRSESLNGLMDVCTFIADNYKLDTPVVLSNDAMDWFIFEGLGDEWGILVFRCTEDKIKQFLDCLESKYLFDWSILLEMFKTINRPSAIDYWKAYESYSIKSLAHKNICGN